MKLKKIVSRILVCAMILGSVPISAAEPVGAGTRSGEGDVPHNGPHLAYTVPSEHEYPRSPIVSAGNEKYTEVKDRAEYEPAEFEDAVSGQAPVIQTIDEIGGFNGQIKSKATDDKFDVFGTDAMIISFKLYVNKLDGPGGNGAVLVGKGDKQFCLAWIGKGLRCHYSLNGTNWNNYSFSNCFTKANKWYDVVLVKDSMYGIRLYVDGKAGNLHSVRSLVHYDDPFAIGVMINGGKVERQLTKEYGYLTDVRFYSEKAMTGEDQTAFDDVVDLQELDKKEDKGFASLNKLMETTSPTADISLRPYRTVTTWSETGSSETLEGSFECGTSYTAKTTITVRKNDPFVFNDDMKTAIEKHLVEKHNERDSSIVYRKIQSGLLTGTADSEEGTDTNEYGDGPAEWAVDGDESTNWHSSYENNDSPRAEFPANKPEDNKNNNYYISLKEEMNIGKFEYLPKNTGNGNIGKIKLHYKGSNDAEWIPINNGEEISWDSTSASLKSTIFNSVQAKEIKIEVVQSNGNFIAAKEFYLYEAIKISAPDVKTDLSADKKTMTVNVTYPETSLPCTHYATTVSEGNIVDLEVGATRELKPVVWMDDGNLMSSHKGFSDSNIYTYTSESPDVATVDKDGVVTGIAVGTAKINVKAAIPGQLPADREIYVEVFEKGSLLVHPEVDIKKPMAGKYPEVAEIKLNEEMTEDPYQSLVTDVMNSDERLERVDPNTEVDVRKINGLLGFNGQYKAPKTDGQYNVTGSNPLVIALKLWVDKLPTASSGDEEWVILSKGNQFSFALKKGSDTDGKVQLRLGMAPKDDGAWPIAAFDVPDNWTGKWHDIVIVFDGKGIPGSMGFFMDDTFVPNGTQVEGTIGNRDYKDGWRDELRPFMVCGKYNENERPFTKECGYISGLKFFNINQVAPELAEKIDLSEDKLGNENGCAKLRYMLDTVKRTAHITATPFDMETRWFEKGNKEVLDSDTLFDIDKIRDSGYTAEITLKSYGNFVFDDDEVGHITDELRHVYLDGIDPDLYTQKAEISEDNKVLTVTVDFHARAMDTPHITYTAPVPNVAPSNQPLSNDNDPKYTMTDSVWSVIEGSDGDESVMPMAPDAVFGEITDTNKYQVETVLKANDEWMFVNTKEYKDEAVKNIKTQRNGNVNAEVVVDVDESQKTMTIKVTYKDPIYTVSFNMGGAIESASEPMQAVSKGNKVNKPKNPVKTGYRFVKWYVEDDETHTEYDFDSEVNENFTLCADWIEQVTVTYDYNMPAMDPTETTVDKGTVVTPEAPEREGYAFKDWYTDRECTEGNKYDFKTAVTEDVTVYAKWAKICTVTFDSQGGTAVSPQTPEEGQKATTPEAPTRDGYTFEGWYTDKDCAEKYSFDEAVTDDITLYAKWERIKYTVTFDSQEGSAVSPQTPYEGNAAITPEAPTREGYAFKGWYTDKEGTEGNKYDFASPVIKNITLYAKWAKTWKVTFETGEGSAVSPQTPEEGQNAITPEAPTRNGYKFKDWYTDAECTDENKYDFATPVTKDITLYAKWVETFTVMFHSQGGSDVEAQIVEKDAAATTPQAPTKDGYKFKGWYTDAECTDENKYDFATPVTENIELFAKWIQIFTVTFNSNGGSDVEAQIVEINATAITPQTPEAPTYGDEDTPKSFMGWYLKDDDSYTKYNFNDPVTANVMLYALWSPVDVVLWDRADKIDIQYIDFGKTMESVSLQAPTPRKGYTFAGWYSDNALTTPNNPDTVIMNTTNLFAKWTLNTVTGITLQAPEPFELEIDQTADLTVIASVEDETDPVDVDHNQITWTSGNEEIATVDGNGQVTAIAEGTTSITATLVDDETMTASVDVVVKKKTYTVTFDYNYESAVTPQTATVVDGEKAATPEAPTRDGYAFKGWYTDKAGTEEYDFDTPVTESFTLYAKWIQIFTVTFDYNYESAVTPQTAEVADGEKASTPEAPTRDGYTFVSWYKDEACTEEYDFNEPVTESFTLYAKWVKAVYTVTFDSQGGTAVSSQTPEAGEKAVTPEAPTRDGYTFVSWYKDEACTEEYDFNEPVTESFTLYAKWTENKPDEYTVTYDSKGGSTVDSETVEAGSAFTKPADPTRAGYTFAGWYTDEACTTEYSFETKATEDITLYAGWTEDKPDEYTVTYDSKGGSAVSSQTVNAGSAFTKPTDPTRAGYTFAGWYTDEACTTAYSFETKATGNITLYAGWTENEPDKYTVTYNSKGGSAVNPETVNAGSAFTKPADPTKDGYTFTGWYTDEACTTAYDFAAQATGNITLYAGWTENEPDKYTVTYNSNGGSAVNPETVEAGSAFTKPADPTRAGYTFEGWYTDEACTKAYDFAAQAAGNMTLYAKWKKVESGNQPQPEAPALKAGEEKVIGDVTVKVVDPKAKTVAIKKGMVAKAKKITISATVKVNNQDYTVVAIEKQAFKGYKNLKQITIPATVKSIGAKAFMNCKKLNKVVLQGTSVKINKAAFKGTSSKLKISAKKMSKKQRAALQKTIRSKGKNKKARVTK